MARSPKERKAKFVETTLDERIRAYGGIDAICRDIVDQKGYADIGQKIGCDAADLCRWIGADPQRIDALNIARYAAADTADQAGLAALVGITDDATRAATTRAREIANHMRWRAMCYSPKRYSQRHLVDLEANVRGQDKDTLIAELRALGVIKDA